MYSLSLYYNILCQYLPLFPVGYSGSMRVLSAAQLQNVALGARYLLGCKIHRKTPDGEVLRARIVETESYHQEDPASHIFRGESPRNKAMFGPAGYAYVYFTYGMHWCFNVTAGPEGYGAGILIRSAEPLEGIETMRQIRRVDDANLTNGPAKLAQAMVIGKELYGHDLTQPPLQIYEPDNRNFEVIATTRIGISRGVDEIARFYIKNNPFVSRK